MLGSDNVDCLAIIVLEIVSHMDSFSRLDMRLYTSKDESDL